MSAILFVLGIPWALIAWLLVVGGPAAMIEEFTAGRWVSALGMLVFWPLFAAHVILGYLVWVRWFSITRGTAAASRRFWLIASAHHCGWIVFGVICHLERDPMPPLIFGYAIAAFIACLIAAVTPRRKSQAVPVRS